MASVTHGATSPKGPASRQPPEVPAECKSGLDGVQLHRARPMSAARHSRRSGSVPPAVSKRGLHELQPQLDWHGEWGVVREISFAAPLSRTITTAASPSI
ncbi:hypothetical protein VC83_00226 [Pseudogymnoascus destructans]|uniref:Uncharacterized protein n=2 Tax=Pseudogymnoascus destructans TaxID=655981 RepID=L8GCM6_PSED2|nr:uncharacterized protein VC83_00226 [Pseudogymnoascus destructans]ELR10574.1 hypothetical protein GMDG_04847 [Pseudogymnoascus destructans 20631-21]OAF62904.1 hypothetical protein VC83_00226 [Pseudogymnoascus destructans]